MAREAAQLKSSPSPAIAAAPAAVSTNSAITTYLGVPVPAPANLDRKYSPEELWGSFGISARRSASRLKSWR